MLKRVGGLTLKNPLRRFFFPDVDGYLLDDQSEVLIAEVGRHWITNVLPTLVIAASIPSFLAMIWLPKFRWVFFILGIVLVLWSVVQLQRQYMHRFAITNMRVFTVAGVLRQESYMLAHSELAEIRSQTGILGRILNYGHLVLLSAQGDKLELRFVTNPRARESQIHQAVIGHMPWPGQDFEENNDFVAETA